MWIRFRISGGFAGLQRACTIDTAGMNREEGQEWVDLVRASGLLSLPARERIGHAPPKAVDLRVIAITIQDESGSHQFGFDDLTLPSEAACLVERLQQHAVCDPLDT
ncbi:MAG: hypothetical protein HQM03_12940 [Magnetococcales bacterium]|nr:hypothetical protein [Magnetococcales bacterium]